MKTLDELFAYYEGLLEENNQQRNSRAEEAKQILEQVTHSEDIFERIEKNLIENRKTSILREEIVKLCGGKMPKRAVFEKMKTDVLVCEIIDRAIENDQQLQLFKRAQSDPKILLDNANIEFIEKCMYSQEKKAYHWLVKNQYDELSDSFSNEYFNCIHFEDYKDDLLSIAYKTIEETLKNNYLYHVDYSHFRSYSKRTSVQPGQVFRFLEDNELMMELVVNAIHSDGIIAFIIDHIDEFCVSLPKAAKMAEHLADQQSNFYEYMTEAICDSNIENDIYCGIEKYFTKKRVLKLLKQNPIYNKVLREKVDADKQRKTLRKNIVTTMPESYIDLYPAARQMSRHFVIHSGPTNSGKTFDALCALKESDSGVYLSPLRMLALEKYEELNEEGYPCDLLTGEEEKRVEDAMYIASTVEMANFDAQYDCAVIDECQMIVDKFRGGGWTAAILGLQAKEIHLCLSPWAEPIVRELIEACCDTSETVYHTRATELTVEKQPFVFPQSVQEHDALIVFSRKNVHAVAAELEQKRIPCSIIYGNLPYDVRQIEAARFRNGLTNVVVSTDAIGMGLNLPIQRVVFLENEKFDGENRRHLNREEIRQIAGRAGRRGIFETGYVATTQKADIPEIEYSISVIEPQNKLPMIGFPEALLGISEPVSVIMKEWQALAPMSGFLKEDLTDSISLAELAESFQANRSDVYKLSTITLDTKNQDEMATWKRLAHSLVNNTLEKMQIPNIEQDLTLEDLEKCFRMMDIYFQFGRVFFVDELKTSAMHAKDIISKKIIRELERQGKERKRCKNCNQLLTWNYPFTLCERCYRNSRRY